MLLPHWLWLLLAAAGCCSGQAASASDVTESSPTETKRDLSFDLFLFAQAWPTTTCDEWKEISKKNKCNPIPSDAWTVHGLWPTQDGRVGPNFCNHSDVFRPELLVPILPRLQSRWTDVHGRDASGTPHQYDFWKHEWQKHGTCAAQIEQVDTELKFFTKGLTLNSEHDLYSYLSSAGILPGHHYSFDALYQAVSSRLSGHHPTIKCAHDRDEQGKKLVRLSQIYICFDKSFQLTDCDDIKNPLDQGCPKKGHNILYPGSSGGKKGGSYLFLTIALIVLVVVLLAVIGWLVYGKIRRRLLYTDSYESI